MSKETISYTLETEIPVTYTGRLFDFIHRKYLLPQKQRFSNISKTMTEGQSSINFTVLDSIGNQSLRVEIIGQKQLNINITPLSKTVADKEINDTRQDISIAVELFEEKLRENTVFFAWREGESIVPETPSGREQKSLNRLFLETQVLLFAIFIGFGLVLFLFVGWFAPVVLMAVQFVFVFFSNRFIARTADWHITKDNPTIHIMEYYLPIEQLEDFRARLPKEKLMKIKKEVYKETIAKKGQIDCNVAGEIFRRHGLECKPENLSSRVVNVYELVERIAHKFGFPMPEVVVSNTLVPNAAASGPSPSRGVVLITTGLLVQLDEDGILSVLGHEFGHLKGRDPLVLYGLMGSEFLFRFYVLLPLFPFIFSSFLFFAYFWAVMTLIYFIAKFFEARADLVSAMVIGKPKVLAGALEEIGFKRLFYERTPAYRVQEWIGLDPHPPVYFRIDRLRKLQDAEIRYPLVQSAKDVVRGFINTLRG